MAPLSDRLNAPDQALPEGQVERRRPGRPGSVNSALLPLLRRDRLLQDALSHREHDDLAAARGIGLGAAVGLAVWLGLAVLAWRIFAG